MFDSSLLIFIPVTLGVFALGGSPETPGIFASKEGMQK